MIQVHHLNNSRSHRILWLLEELNQCYEVISYQRDRATMLAPPELATIHPLGKSPVIKDGELVLAESGAIIEYLIGKYGNGKLIPAAGSDAHVKYLYWFHFAERSAMPPRLAARHGPRRRLGAGSIAGKCRGNASDRGQLFAKCSGCCRISVNLGSLTR